MPKIDAFLISFNLFSIIPLFSVFNVLLNRYTLETDLCVGSGVANRNAIETEQLIGMIVNTIALRSDLSGNPDFYTLLKLMEIEKENYLLLMTFHHIVMDGRSLANFSRELNLFYEAAFMNRPHGLPPLAIQYADFAYCQQTLIVGK